MRLAASKGLAAADPAVLALARGGAGGSPARCIRTGARKGGPAPGPADVLIVDGTNLAFSAAADRTRWAQLGATLAGCFGDHLAFLAAAMGQPAERYVVFDRAKRDNVPLRRQLAYPDYLKTRASRLHVRRKPELASWASRLAAQLRKLLWGAEVRQQRLWAAARAQGYVPLEAQGGWEADDAIAALRRLVQESEGGRQLRIAVVSNDSDLHQLLDERTSVVAVQPWHKEASGAGPLVTVTAASSWAAHGFPPPVFPFMRALGGKKHSNVAGLGLPPSTVRRVCQHVSLALSQGARLEDGGLPPGLERVLGPDAEATLAKLRANLRLTQLHTASDALPPGFARQAARSPAPVLACEAAAAEGGPAPGTPEQAAAAHSYEAPSAATLVWLSPFNAARARYLRPHVAALCACLQRAGVRHRAWAVSEDGLPIDIAILAEPAKLVRHGFTPHSVVLILGEGDLRDLTPVRSPPPALHAPRGGEQRVLEALRTPPPAPPQLSLPAAARLKALRKAGWHVHVISHATLQALLQYKVPTTPLR